MKIEVLDDPVPRHWCLLQKIVARDSQLCPDVTLIVDGKSIRVVDGRGIEIRSPTPLITPLILRDADLTQRAEQIELLVWIWWNFGPERVQKQRPLTAPCAGRAPLSPRPVPLAPGGAPHATPAISGAWAQRV
jgi:hypothetical protein